MTGRYSGFEHFLATHVMYRVGNLITAFPKANSVFKKHIEKVLTAAKIYGKRLQAEYKKAEKRRLTDSKKQTNGKDYQAVVCSDGEWADVFFETPDIKRSFRTKGKPKPNPLHYLRSVVWGQIGKTPRGISLLDYQYFLVACIYDSQCRPGQRRIYFSPEPEDSAVWDKQLKDRICRRVWLALVKWQRYIDAQVDITAEWIQAALRAIEADLTGGSKFTEDVPVLKEDQLKVLDYLNKEYPQIRYGTDIEAATDISRKTVGLYLKTLKLYELVCPPEGKKKGYVITLPGKKYIGKHFS
jgi:hypothetical protein